MKSRKLTLAPAQRRHLERLFQQAQRYQQRGDAQTAARLYRRFLQAVPGHPVASHYLGLALYQQGRTREALALLEPLGAPLKDDPAYWNNLGLVLAADGQPVGAMEACRKALGIDHRFSGAWFNLGVYSEQAGKTMAAVDAYGQCLALRPDHYKARHNLGLLLRDLGRYLEAEQLYREGIRLRDDFPGFHEGLIDTLYQLGRAVEAESHLRRLHDLSAKAGGGHLSLARIHRLRGEYEEASSQYLAHLQQEPGSPAALAGLCRVKRVTEEERELLECLRGVLQRPLSVLERRQVHFALGKGHADLKEHDAAFEHYRLGNALMAREVCYERKRHEARVQTLLEVFNDDLLECPVEERYDLPRPVFIVGMPRSGTTLVEQILAAHPCVVPGGELPYIGELQQLLQQQAPAYPPFPASLKTLEQGRLRELAAKYLSWLRTIDPEADQITDKMPFNYRWIGLIHLMFPRAAIIHCRRDPVDTCLSCYFQDFSARIDFAWRLEDLAHYYGLYRRMMEHWEAVLPGRILHLDYEALVSDPEPQVRRLLEYCNLDWNDACLRFHEVKRPVLTASTWQVRQPLYTSSVKRWKRYEKHLGPLLEGLKPWLEDEPVAG